jgi:acyl-CoA reductase-like NAD-dependent aldehyde dehydrogenase
VGSAAPADYDRLVATATLDRLLLVGGDRVDTGRWLDVRSPYSGELVGRVASGGADEARAAVDAAHAAMRSPLPAHERAAILERVRGELHARAEEVARVLSAEAAKPIGAARLEVERAQTTLTAAAVAARTLAGEVVPMDASVAGAGKIAFTIRVPIGVVAAITPFNFPLNLVVHKLAPALAAGCAVVLKPAEKTPLSAFALADAFEAAGLPAGWLNVVAGDPIAIGDVLVEDERVRLITFTGSGAVGWAIRERAPRKRVLLELGNATPAIVLADADLDLAAERLAATAFLFAGQACVSVQRIYVERTVRHAFLDRFLPRVEALRTGDPADEETDVGPVIDAASRERILSWIEAARTAGATILAGGDATDDGVVRPTVIADAAPDLDVSCREVFGPLCTVNAVDSLDEALRLANATAYGLQAGIFTRDLGAALRAAQQLEFGAVVVNETPSFRADPMPYGGVKDSGNTKEGPEAAVREMTEERLVVLATEG